MFLDTTSRQASASPTTSMMVSASAAARSALSPCARISFSQWRAMARRVAQSAHARSKEVNSVKRSDQIASAMKSA
ncbi:MAG: hypothetical protein IPH72_07835 [Sandaracinaceae bacterium]|nr:hypothetical protein [Sandaracinaceae bacterium]